MLCQIVGQSGTKWDAGIAGVSAFRQRLEHMFLGQFVHSIDSKGRITIPVGFRAALASGAYVTQGFERNLVVYTTEDFQRMAQRAATLTTTNPEARAIRRVIFGRAADIGLDSAGRILVPTFQREYAQLEGEATIVGAGEYFEIWSSELWSGELASVSDPEVNAKRFTEFDLSSAE
jgi:MraZ protein